MEANFAQAQALAKHIQDLTEKNGLNLIFDSSDGSEEIQVGLVESNETGITIRFHEKIQKEEVK